MESEKTIHDVIKERMKLPEEVKKFIKLNIFFNILIAIVMLICTLIVNIAYSRFSSGVFEKYINIFQLVLAIITIAFFETAYKKDSFLVSFYGIEMFIFSLTIMFVPYFYILKGKLNVLIFVTILFSVYYTFKSIFTGIYLRNNYIKNNISDVKEIVKDHKESYIDEKSTKTLRENKKKKQENNVKLEKTRKAGKIDKKEDSNKKNKENNIKNESSKKIKDSNKEVKEQKTQDKKQNKQNNKSSKEYSIEKLNENINRLKKIKNNENKSD